VATRCRRPRNERHLPDPRPPTPAQRTDKLQGMGCRRKRVEDVRFTQGRGNYVDDMKLPGMLYGDFVRSSYAHARIKNIDTSKAKAVPGVVAVLTAADLAPLKLHWMPTLAGDVQMVLADGKVLFQNQEIAFVVATDRYVAADAAELVEVEYEELPPLVDPFKAMAADAPVLREDLAGKTTGAHGARKHHNHIFEWSVGRSRGDRPRVQERRGVNKGVDFLPARASAPLETCQCVASFDKIKGELTLWGTFQAPHVVRTVAAILSGIPSTRSMSSPPTSAAGSVTRSALSRLRLFGSRLHRNRQAGEMG